MSQTPTLTDLRYPIGDFMDPVESTPEQVEAWIQILEEFPARLRSTVKGMSDEQLDTPYREGGWTVRQVVHHLVDSHVNSYIRFKLAVTESNPTIKPYFEDRWAELTDGKLGPVNLSLDFLEALHKRWTFFLRGLKPGDWQKTYLHPESGKVWKLTNVLAMYAWHCRHHHAHITSLAGRMGWSGQG